MVDMKTIAVSCAILVLCDAYAVVDKPKCTLSDGDCHAKLYGGILQDIFTNGDPDLNIPPLDPYIIKKFDINILNMIKVTLVDGKMVGLKNCHSNSFKIDVEALHAHIDYTCDTYHVEGHQKVSKLPALEALLADLKIQGEGPIKIDLEKVNLVFDFAFKVVKLDDGELHIQLIQEASTHAANVAGKATFDITNLYIGSQDIGKVATAILNENWQGAMRLFGQNMLDNIMGVFYAQAEKFFNGVPAKNLFSEDLSKYVKN